MFHKQFDKCITTHSIDNNSKFMFLPTTSTTFDDIFNTFVFFTIMGILNAIVCIPHPGFGYLIVVTSNPHLDSLKQQIYVVRNDNTSVDYLFPDKLQNLHGYSYSVIFYNEMPRLYEKNGKFVGLEMKFLDVVTEKQNATYNIKFFLDRADEKFLNYYPFRLNDKSADISMNTGIGNIQNTETLESINTYEVLNYCALIPNPPRVSFFDYIFKPFDALTRMF